MADVLECKFPVGSLVPKSETGVLSFLQKYPEFDGRDVTIAIFDSGVDPKAAGLEVTKDGSVKVIERFDCSGCGDTNTSTKVTANADGYITGLSGRQLKITQLMKDTNKDGNEYRVGLKSLHDLYPSKIREKVTLDVKTKKWDGLHRRAVADVAREWHALDQKNSGPSKSSCLSFKDKIKKENLDSSIEFLNNCDKKFLDIKTTYDVILYNSEEGWQAVLDTSEKGDLEKAVCLGEYSKTHELKHVDDFLSISINVHDNGDVLEFVGMCCGHLLYLLCD